MGLALALATPAFGNATRTETARLKVGPHVVRWHTAQRVHELLDVRLTINGQYVPFDHARSCAVYAGWRGVSVKVEGCGPGAQTLRVSAISLRRANLLVRFHYR